MIGTDKEKKKKARKKNNKPMSSKNVMKLYLSMKLRGSSPITFDEGDKVKLNIRAIKGDKNYERLTKKYQDFIDSHADDIFTVKRDKAHKDTNTLVCLLEDTEGWLFWTGYLLLVERVNDKIASEN